MKLTKANLINVCTLTGQKNVETGNLYFHLRDGMVRAFANPALLNAEQQDLLRRQYAQLMKDGWLVFEEEEVDCDQDS